MIGADNVKLDSTATPSTAPARPAAPEWAHQPPRRHDHPRHGAGVRERRAARRRRRQRAVAPLRDRDGRARDPAAERLGRQPAGVRRLLGHQPDRLRAAVVGPKLLAHLSASGNPFSGVQTFTASHNRIVDGTFTGNAAGTAGRDRTPTGDRERHDGQLGQRHRSRHVRRQSRQREPPGAQRQRDAALG